MDQLNADEQRKALEDALNILPPDWEARKDFLREYNPIRHHKDTNVRFAEIILEKWFLVELQRLQSEFVVPENSTEHASIEKHKRQRARVKANLELVIKNLRAYRSGASSFFRLTGGSKRLKQKTNVIFNEARTAFQAVEVTSEYVGIYAPRRVPSSTTSPTSTPSEQGSVMQWRSRTEGKSAMTDPHEWAKSPKSSSRQSLGSIIEEANEIADDLDELNKSFSMLAVGSTGRGSIARTASGRQVSIGSVYVQTGGNILNAHNSDMDNPTFQVGSNNRGSSSVCHSEGESQDNPESQAMVLSE